MPSTVEIVVKGIALWFKKDNCWNALLPFDDCHNVEFSFSTGDAIPSRRRSLARKNAKIKITLASLPNPVTPPPSTTAFDSQVLNLTSPPAASGPQPPYITHRTIRKKANLGDNTVYLRLGSAELSVFDYVQDLTDDPLHLHGTITKLQRLDSVAHWVKGTIVIPDGDALNIQINSENPISLRQMANTNYKIVINNDCRSLTKQNDMKMYYEYVITGFEDAGATSSEQFWVGELKDLSETKVNLGALNGIEALTAEHSSMDTAAKLRAIVGILTGDAKLLEGKPCMNVQATDTGDLPSFP